MRHFGLVRRRPASSRKGSKPSNELETNRDILGRLLESDLSQASNRMNAVMKRLTALAMIGLPFTVISGYFGMNFEVMPWLKRPWGIARRPS